MKYGNTVVEMRQSYSGLICSVITVKWYDWVVIWWLWMSLASVQAAISCTAVSEIPATECQVLLDLYNATGGPSWTDAATNNWNVTNTPCSWTGITCGGGHVTQIFRINKNLIGALPSSLSTLTSLEILALNDNQLNNTIPDLSTLTNLVYLHLYNNQLTGNIPNTSTGVQYFKLYGNHLTGTIPTWINTLTSLQQLALSYNQLSGSIPPLPVSVTYLDLSRNQLDGTISDLSPLTGLSGIDLSYNKLTGETGGSATAKQPDWADTQTVPPTSVNVSILSPTSIQLNWTPITYTADGGYYTAKCGTNPGGPYSYTATTANKTATTATVTGLSPGTTYYCVVDTYTPAHSNQQNNLTSIWSSEVSATTPTSTNCAPPAQTDIPQAECQALVDLYNSTGGPSWTDAATNNWNKTNSPCSWAGVTCSGGVVTQVARTSQNLIGTLPTTLNALTSLQYLDLSGNQLSGAIPALPNGLQWLDLSRNKLSGTIPALPNGLVNLYLYTNQLSGTIPALPNGLQWLNLSVNQLSGTIPALPNSLVNLYLYTNQLSGTIPALPNSLVNLNLSVNQLSGTVPALPNSLQYLNLSYNKLSGTIPALPNGLVNLWLSDNQLNGTIPALPNGLQWLDLSRNQLSGTIPTLPTSLGSLVLSKNQLIGNIPDLSTLTNLYFLALDNNQLTGSIPNLPNNLGNQANPGCCLLLQNNQLTGTIPDLSGTALTAGAGSNVDLSCNRLTSETGTSATDRDSDWATTQCFPPPIAPTNLTATAVSQTQIDLSWTDNSMDETGFKIESPAGTLIQTTAAAVTNYSHTGLACNTTYSYSITATNAYGDSAPITASATTQSCPSNPPSLNLTIRAMGNGAGTIGYQLSDIQGNPLSGKTSCNDAQAGCSYGISSGTWVKLVATADANSVFAGWSGDNSGCSSGSLFMTQTASCTAYFNPLSTYNLTVSLTGTGSGTVTSTPAGISCGSSCSASFKTDTIISLTATAATGSEFKGFSGDCVGGQVTMEQAKSCQALFDLVAPVVEPPPVTEQPSTTEASSTTEESPVTEESSTAEEATATEEPPTTEETPVTEESPATEPPATEQAPPVVEQPPVTTAPAILPQFTETEGSTGVTNPDIPSNGLFLTLIRTQLGQVGTKLTIDAPEQLVVTAKVRPYHKHLGQRADIIALYHWTPDGQTQPTVFTIRIKTHIKLVDDMEITIFRGILYDLYGTFRANLYYQLEDGTRIGTENAATLKINKNHPPTDILLSNHTVKKGSPQNTVIGTLSTIDEDRGELPPLYGLVDDAGGRFAVRNDQLVIRRAWLVKQAGSYPIIVRSIDTLGEYIDKPFTIEVTD